MNKNTYKLFLRNILKSRATCIVGLAIAGVLTINPGLAQTPPTSDQESQSSENEVDQSVQNDRQDQEESNPNPPDEVFIPSEELSEDSSAPFPVDI